MEEILKVFKAVTHAYSGDHCIIQHKWIVHLFIMWVDKDFHLLAIHIRRTLEKMARVDYLHNKIDLIAFTMSDGGYDVFIHETSKQKYNTGVYCCF